MSQLKSLLIALILVGGVSLASAANTWTAPTVAAPNGNVDAPVNVSPVTQFKKGGLVLEGLNAAGEILAYPFSVINGNVGIGTAMPKGKLSVMGTALANDFCIHDAEGVSTGKCLSMGTGGEGGTARAIDSRFPDGLICTDGNKKMPLYLTGIKPSDRNVVQYESFADVGGQHTLFEYDILSGDFVTRDATTDAYRSAADQCAKNINQIPHFSIGGSASAGVSRIIAGSGVTVSPAGGTGEVTVSADGGAWTSANLSFNPTMPTLPSGIQSVPNPLASLGQSAPTLPKSFRITMPSQCSSASEAKFSYQINSQGNITVSNAFFAGEQSGPVTYAGPMLAVGGRDSQGVAKGKFSVWVQEVGSTPKAAYLYTTGSFSAASFIRLEGCR